jgi:hypothetical protein
MGLLGGHRPDITPAQAAAVAAGGVPIVSKLAAAFGVWAPSAAQQAALADALTWGGVLAAALIVGDTGIRAARNAKDGRVESAAMAAGPPPAPPAALAPDLPLEEELPSDAAEFAEPDTRRAPEDPARGGL